AEELRGLLPPSALLRSRGVRLGRDVIGETRERKERPVGGDADGAAEKPARAGAQLLVPSLVLATHAGRIAGLPLDDLYEHEHSLLISQSDRTGQAGSISGRPRGTPDTTRPAKALASRSPLLAAP